MLHVVAALPGDKVFGDLPHDCDEGLLLAVTGFFTDMALSWFLDRPVIYTPLKICSVYAGVIGAVATAGQSLPNIHFVCFEKFKNNVLLGSAQPLWSIVAATVVWAEGYMLPD